MEKELIYMKVELNKINYSPDDGEFLITNIPKGLKIEFSREEGPSAIGWDAIKIYIYDFGTFISNRRWFLSCIW